jgi:glycosyltransferase involved in cell wall biosynthesis
MPIHLSKNSTKNETSLARQRWCGLLSVAAFAHPLHQFLVRAIMSEISIIIPVFNEAQNIASVHDACLRQLTNTSMEWEIIFVDDGSTDGTPDVLDGICGTDKRSRSITLRRNYGQSAAIMAGLDQAKYPILVLMDGDGQNDPADIPMIVEKLEEGYDVVSGWRKNRRDTYVSRILPSRIANWFISAISGIRLHDYGCTLKAYRRDVMRDVRIYGEMHRFIPIYASWEGARVEEVVVRHHPRKFGTSKYGLSRTLKVVLDVLVVTFLQRYLHKPIYLFGGFGLLNFWAALVSFVLMLWFKFGERISFIETPLPLLVVLFLLVGIMSMLLGLLAEMVMRTYFESQGKTAYGLKKERD